MAKAEEIRANLEKELNLKALNNSKSNNNSSDILFIEYLFYWLEIIRHTVANSTFTSYRQISNNHIKKYFTENPIKLVDLTHVHIQDFYNELMVEKHLSANTVVHHHAIIRKCLEYAFKMDIKTKNKSSYRSLPLLDDIADKLLELKEKQEAFKNAFGKTYNRKYLDYVFVNPQGRLIRPDYISEHFSILLNKIGMKHIRFHDLRHSCASLLLAKGIPMKAIQEWLGHSNFSTTANLYAHLDVNSKKLSADALVNALKFTDTKKENEENTSSSSQK